MSDNPTRRALLETVHFVPVFYFVAAIVALIRSYALAANRFDEPFFLVLTGLPIAVTLFLASGIKSSGPFQSFGMKFPRWAQIVSLLLFLIVLFNIVNFGIVRLKYPGSPCTFDGRNGLCQHGFVELTESEFREVKAATRFLVRSGLAILAVSYLAVALYLQRSAEDA